MFVLFSATALNRRLRDREKEKEIDERDRLKEKEELDEILQRLKEEGNPDPEAEVAKIVKEFEENMNKPLKERERELKDRKKKKDGGSSHLSVATPLKTYAKSTSPVKSNRSEDAKMNSAAQNESDRKSCEREDRRNESDSDNQSNKETSDAENAEKEKIAALMTNGNFTTWVGYYLFVFNRCRFC